MRYISSMTRGSVVFVAVVFAACLDNSKVNRFGCEVDNSCVAQDGGRLPVEQADAGEPDAGLLVPDAGPQRLEVLAGDVGGTGNVDGFSSEARLNTPWDLVVDAAGNTFFSDYQNHVIRKLAPDGLVTVFAGQKGVSGSADGTGSAARFFGPVGLALTETGLLLVADSANHTIRQISPQGQVTTLAGLAGVSGVAGGVGSAARFNNPNDIAIDATGLIYVADAANQLIRRVTPGGFVENLSGTPSVAGAANGTANTATFNFPSRIAFSPKGFLVVIDSSYAIRRVNLDGSVSTLSGVSNVQGVIDGPPGVALFSTSGDVIASSTGVIFLTDAVNNVIRKIELDGTAKTLAGKAGEVGSVDGLGPAARFSYPRGLALDASGNLLVADSLNHTIRKMNAATTVTTVAGKAPKTGKADGSPAESRFASPGGMALNSRGSVLVADVGNGQLREINAQGLVSTLSLGAVADGGMPALLLPRALTVLKTDDIVWTEAATCTLLPMRFRHSIVQRRSPNGTVSLVAGLSGENGAADGPGATARLSCPSSIASDPSGALFIADTNNHTIRRISPDGLVSTFAGVAGMQGSADGTATAARFFSPRGVAFDASGMLYVADSGNNTIRKVTPSGEVSTLAGQANQVGSEDGKGIFARFSNPRDVSVRADGTIFVADTGNHTIRKVSPDGQVSTVIGRAGGIGAVPGILPGSLSFPAGVLVLPNGQLAITSANAVLVTAGPPL